MKKKVIVWFVTAVVLLVAFFFILGDQNIFSLYQDYRSVKAKTVEIQQAHHTIDSLAQETKRLEKDTVYLEKIAREKLGMARKGEKVYKFVGEK